MVRSPVSRCTFPWNLVLMYSSPHLLPLFGWLIPRFLMSVSISALIAQVKCENRVESGLASFNNVPVIPLIAFCDLSLSNGLRLQLLPKCRSARPSHAQPDIPCREMGLATGLETFIPSKQDTARCNSIQNRFQNTLRSNRSLRILPYGQLGHSFTSRQS